MDDSPPAALDDYHAMHSDDTLPDAPEVPLVPMAHAGVGHAGRDADAASVHSSASGVSFSAMGERLFWPPRAELDTFLIQVRRACVREGIAARARHSLPRASSLRRRGRPAGVPVL